MGLRVAQPAREIVGLIPPMRGGCAYTGRVTDHDPVHSRSELAAALGVHESTLRRWISAGGMPGGGDGPWNTEQVRAWAAQRRSRAARRAPVSSRLRSDRDSSGTAAVPSTSSERDPAVDLEELRGAALEEEARRHAVRFRRARADREELELARVREALISRSDVEKLLVERALTFKRSLMPLGRRLAPILAGLEARQVQQRLDAEIRAILEEYSRG